MLTSLIGRGWRAIFIACAIIAPDAGHAAAAPEPLVPAPVLSHLTEPFNIATASLPAATTLGEKWAATEREIDSEMLVLALCQDNRSRCKSSAAERFLDIVELGRTHEGRARLGLINRAINLAIRPASDEELYGAPDVWRAPLQLFTVGAGDCEDYAIAKYVALRMAGIARDDLRLVILHDDIRDEDHAVTSVRLDGRWWLLDNRRMAMVEDVSLLHHRPLFVLDEAGIRQYRDAPMMAGARQRAVEPAELH